jgi:AcrR family transcriptional regulator
MFAILSYIWLVDQPNECRSRENDGYRCDGVPSKPDNRVIAEVLNNAPAIAGGTERVDHKQVVPGRKLEDRDNVLSNAARLFREKGFDKTSLKEIAEACEMLPGSLHYRYSTKEALLVELMRQGVGQVTAEVETARVSSDNPVERLRLCIDAHLRALLVDSDTVYVLLFEWRALTREAREEIIELRDRYESLWAHILAEMIQQGVIRRGVDDRLLRLIGLGALNWVATWFDPEGAYTLDDISEFIWQITLDGVIVEGCAG